MYFFFVLPDSSLEIISYAYVESAAFFAGEDVDIVIFLRHIFLMNWISGQARDDRVLLHQYRFRVDGVVQHTDDFAGGAIKVNRYFASYPAVIAD